MQIGSGGQRGSLRRLGQIVNPTHGQEPIRPHEVERRAV
jgi:hypothetical protein